MYGVAAVLPFCMMQSQAAPTAKKAVKTTAKKSPVVSPQMAPLVGEWTYSTIGGPRYYDRDTGAFRANGYGSAQTYTFTPDGRYKMFNYLHVQTYGSSTEVSTWTEGMVAFKDGKMLLNVKKGRIKYVNGDNAAKSWDRPMDKEALKRNSRAYAWKVEKDDNGKPVLRMGETEENLWTYTRDK
jgi:hypothetical protein